MQGKEIYYSKIPSNKNPVLTKFNIDAKEFHPNYTQPIKYTQQEIEKLLTDLHYDPGLIENRCLAIYTFLKIHGFENDLLADLVTHILANVDKDTNFCFTGTKMLNYLMHKIPYDKSCLLRDIVFDKSQEKYDETVKLDHTKFPDQYVKLSYWLADCFCQIDIRYDQTYINHQDVDFESKLESKYIVFYGVLVDLLDKILQPPYVPELIKSLTKVLKMSGYELDNFEARLEQQQRGGSFIPGKVSILFNKMKDLFLSNDISKDLKIYLFNTYLSRHGNWGRVTTDAENIKNLGAETAPSSQITTTGDNINHNTQPSQLSLNASQSAQGYTNANPATMYAQQNSIAFNNANNVNGNKPTAQTYDFTDYNINNSYSQPNSSWGKKGHHISREEQDIRDIDQDQFNDENEIVTQEEQDFLDKQGIDITADDDNSDLGETPLSADSFTNYEHSYSVEGDNDYVTEEDIAAKLRLYEGEINDPSLIIEKSSNPARHLGGGDGGNNLRRPDSDSNRGSSSRATNESSSIYITPVEDGQWSAAKEANK